MSRVAGIFPAHDDIPARAQLPYIAAQVEIAVFEFHRVSDAEPVAAILAHEFLLIRTDIGASADALRAPRRMLT